MIFHARALEVYTNAFHSLQECDLEKDMEDFRSKIHINTGTQDARPINATNLSSNVTWTTSSLSLPSTLQRQTHVEEEDSDDETEDEEDEEPIRSHYSRVRK
ncbi:unnamed protein product [Staurois parvus]|uniref:Uncharacterized protein n=1 Tax=Staurois parvus TaxID=386267 RepID=A0ABN9B7P9_9NEOB|nr:unnamed protein product [Staurois parvus]